MAVNKQFKQQEIQRQLDNLDQQLWRTDLYYRKAKALGDKSEEERQKKQLDSQKAERDFYAAELKVIEKEPEPEKKEQE